MTYPRYISPLLLETLEESPASLLLGARQVGKSTLVQSIADARGYQYLSFDNIVLLQAALEDPRGFIANLEKPVVLDEIQRVPSLFLSLKEDIDTERSPGRYIFTGSANVLSLPKMADSLAGRMSIFQLYPLAQAEITGQENNVVDALFQQDFSQKQNYPRDRDELIARIIAGGYPEALGKRSERSRRIWFDSYLSTIIQRDVQDIAKIEGLHHMPKLLHLLAARSATLLNSSAISREIALSYPTLRRYITLLEAIFLIHLLPAWHVNLGKKAVKSPKIILSDTGLACHLLHLDAQNLVENPTLLGQFLENFVILELMKHLSWSEEMPKAYHYRSQQGDEVDMVLEGRAGRMIGIEVKHTHSPSAKDARGLLYLRDNYANHFKVGYVFSMVEHVMPLADKIYALPLAFLWR